jgi:chromate transport protein ChrA
VAGNLFGLPGFVSILALSILHASYQDVGVMEAVFVGLKFAMLAILVQAVIEIGSRAKKPCNGGACRGRLHRHFLLSGAVSVDNYHDRHR